MSLTSISTEQLRKIRDYIPELSNRPPAFDLGKFINDMITSLNADKAAIKSGTGTISGSDTTVAIAVGAAYDAKPVVACLNGQTAGGAAANVTAATWDGSGNLTITLNTAPTAGKTATVSFIVDARS